MIAIAAVCQSFLTESSTGSGDSDENFLHDSAMDISKPAIDATMTHGELFVIDAEDVENRGMEVVSRRHAVDGFPRPFVALAVGNTRLHSAAGKP